MTGIDSMNMTFLPTRISDASLCHLLVDGADAVNITEDPLIAIENGYAKVGEFFVTNSGVSAYEQAVMDDAEYERTVRRLTPCRFTGMRSRARSANADNTERESIRKRFSEDVEQLIRHTESLLLKSDR